MSVMPVPSCPARCAASTRTRTCGPRTYAPSRRRRRFCRICRICPELAAADLAASGLGALIRHAPHLPGRGAAGEQPEAMPSPDPAPLEPADGSPPPDEVLELLRRSGEPRNLGATVRQWYDLVATAAWIPEGIRAAGRGGLASLLAAMTRGMNVTRTDARLRVSGPDRYRLDFSSRPDRNAPTTIACDGECRWRVYQDRTLVGPAASRREQIAFLADSSWLLRGRLSGGAELTYRGRAARRLRVTSVPGGEELVLGLLMIFPADAIVDAETGCLLRLISYADDTLVIWSELDDISTGPTDPDEFRVHVPHGIRASIRDGTGRAARMLAATPELVRYSFATTVILGDAGRVRTELGLDPGLATQADTRTGWAPLHAASASR